MLWITGYPFGVNLSRGYPRYNPGEYTAQAVLARGEADAALLVAAHPQADLSEAALAHLASIPAISLGSRETPVWPAASVAFRTAAGGIGRRAPSTAWTTCRCRYAPRSRPPIRAMLKCSLGSSSA